MLILLEKRQIKASGRRAGSEIAANGATDASANGGTDVRQTKARMFRQTAGDHPETIIKGDNYSDTPSVLSVLSILSALSSHQYHRYFQYDQHYLSFFPYCYMLVHPPPSSLSKAAANGKGKRCKMQRQTAGESCGKRQNHAAANGKKELARNERRMV